MYYINFGFVIDVLLFVLSVTGLILMGMRTGDIDTVIIFCRISEVYCLVL